MSRLELHLLGSPEVQLNDSTIVVKERKALALLIYLGVTGDPHQRETLATLLWPEYSYKQGRTNLRRVLYVLRKAIGDEWLEIEGESVSLNPAADIWIDVREFSGLTTMNASLVELGQRDLDRPGGYLRILKTGYRPGDNAPMAYIELVDRPQDDAGDEAIA